MRRAGIYFLPFLCGMAFLSSGCMPVALDLPENL